ncbi:MAG: 30S ribosome-binding factor RbfA [Planctomycetota bacterium]|nr:30S ribosome-binding factor RbfA [Planctomycetota bacterium]
MGYKIEKLSRKIQRDISDIIHREMNDPRIAFASITRIDLTRDLKFAKVWVSVMGERSAQSRVMKALEHAKGFIQSEVARRLHTRQTPILTFYHDKGIEQSIRISKILSDVLPPETDPDPEEEETPSDTDA